MLLSRNRQGYLAFSIPSEDQVQAPVGSWMLLEGIRALAQHRPPYQTTLDGSPFRPAHIPLAVLSVRSPPEILSHSATAIAPVVAELESSLPQSTAFISLPLRIT